MTKLVLIVLFVVVCALLIARRSSSSPPEGDTPLAVFMTRSPWTTLPHEFLEAMARKLASAERAKEFVVLCESTGMLENNIVKMARHEPAFAIGSVATALTSYANAMGAERNFKEAKRALELALLLRPRHLAAWMSMALVTVNLDDCAAAVSWADKVLTYKPDDTSNDPWEKGQADPDAVDDTVRDQMRTIKEVCRGKTLAR